MYSSEKIVWICRFVQDLDMVIDSGKPTTVFVDNQVAIDFASNHSINYRLKHIDVCFKNTPDALCNSELCLRYHPTENITANLITKRLGPVKISIFFGQVGQQECKICY